MGFVEVFIIIIVGLLLLFIFYMLGIYNKLLFLKNKLLDKYNTLEIEILNISNEMDKIIDVVKDMYGEDKIQDIKIVNRNLKGDDEPNNRMHKVQGLIKFLYFVEDKLKDNKKLKEYEDNINAYIDRIKYASNFYNECVDKYNEYIDNPLVKIIYKLFKFREYDKFVLVDGD